MRKRSKKYPMYPERLRRRLLARDSHRPAVTRREPEPTSDVMPDLDEDGNAFKGILIALGLSIPFWLLVGFLIRWMK